MSAALLFHRVVKSKDPVHLDGLDLIAILTKELVADFNESTL